MSSINLSDVGEMSFDEESSAIPYTNPTHTAHHNSIHTPAQRHTSDRQLHITIQSPSPINRIRSQSFIRNAMRRELTPAEGHNSVLSVSRTLRAEVEYGMSDQSLIAYADEAVTKLDQIFIIRCEEETDGRLLEAANRGERDWALSIVSIFFMIQIYSIVIKLIIQFVNSIFFKKDPFSQVPITCRFCKTYNIPRSLIAENILLRHERLCSKALGKVFYHREKYIDYNNN
jgi:hypothetical protein